MSRCEGLTQNERVVFILLIGIAAVALWAVVFLHILPNKLPSHDVDPWFVALAGYPDGDAMCHAAVVDRMQRMSDVLYTGPYAMGEFGNYTSLAKAEMLATRMVIEGGLHVPECDAPP